MKRRYITAIASFVVVFMGTVSFLYASNGYFLHGFGAVNESLGGAATAGNTQDVLGSIYKNPANANLFGDKTRAVCLTAIFPKVSIKSSVSLLNLSGKSDSEVDIIPGINMGVVFNNKETSFAGYVALISEAGLHLDMPESATNPIFIKQQGKAGNPLGGLYGGFGAVESQIEVVRLPLGMSYQNRKHISFGFSVAPSVSRMKFMPSAFAAPDDNNNDGIPTYPDDIDLELTFGIGFQAGVRFQPTDKMSLGMTFTSPTWFKKFEWNVVDEAGEKRKISFRINRPLSLHMGGNYCFSTGTQILADLSWINYADTEGFDETGFAADGSMKGLGFNNIWVLALGVQHGIRDEFTIRAGYNYGKNPIDDSITFFNVASPLHTRHHLSAGLSWQVSNHAFWDVAYTHAFKSSQSGPMYLPSGEVSGTKVESLVEYCQVAVGVTVSY